MDSQPTNLFLGFDLADFDSLVELGHGLRYWTAGGRHWDGRGLTQIQQSTVENLARCAETSPLMGTILNRFKKQSTAVVEGLLADGNDLQEFATIDAQDPEKPGYQKAVKAWVDRIISDVSVPKKLKNDQKSISKDHLTQIAIQQQIEEDKDVARAMQASADRGADEAESVGESVDELGSELGDKLAGIKDEIESLESDGFGLAMKVRQNIKSYPYRILKQSMAVTVMTAIHDEIEIGDPNAGSAPSPAKNTGKSPTMRSSTKPVARQLGKSKQTKSATPLKRKSIFLEVSEDEEEDEVEMSWWEVPNISDEAKYTPSRPTKKQKTDGKRFFARQEGHKAKTSPSLIVILKVNSYSLINKLAEIQESSQRNLSLVASDPTKKQLGHPPAKKFPSLIVILKINSFSLINKLAEIQDSSHQYPPPVTSNPTELTAATVQQRSTVVMALQSRIGDEEGEGDMDYAVLGC